MLRTPVVRNVGVTSVGGSLTGGPNTYTTLENKPDGRKTRFLEVECNRLPKDYIFSIAEKVTEPKKNTEYLVSLLSHQLELAII